MQAAMCTIERCARDFIATTSLEARPCCEVLMEPGSLEDVAP